MTVAENVQMALISHARRDLSGFGGRRRRATATARSNCSRRSAWRDAADRACRELAYGDVKRVELAIALANEPRLLLMDEPTAGMAPRERNELIALVKRLVVERGISVLFTEHSMDVVFAYADRIIVLARGKLIADGDAAAIRDNPKVQEVYFGTGKTFERAPERRRHERDRCSRWRRSTRGTARRTSCSTCRFEVGRGEVVALMGRNGAGKSTTHEGHHGAGRAAQRHGAFLRRATSRGCKPFEIARLGLGFVPEDRRIFSDLTVLENLDIGRQPPRSFPTARRRRPGRRRSCSRCFPISREMPDRLGGHMSGGEQQMLTVARTLMGNPLLVLLDEPSEGRRAGDRRADGQHHRRAEEGRACRSCCPSRTSISRELVSDRVYVLEKGQIRWQGSMARARRQYRRAAQLPDASRES